MRSLKVSPGSLKWLVILLVAAAALVVLIAGGSRLLSKPANTPGELPLIPARPPLAYLLVENDAGVHAQQGVMTHYDWLVEGEMERYTGDLPWPMPDRVPALQRDTVVLKLGTMAAPVTIDISLLSRSGLGKELPSVLYSCENSRINIATHHPCNLALNADQGAQGWEVTVPLPLPAGTHFLLASVIWVGFPLPHDPSTGGQSVANWFFSIEKSR